MKIKHMTPPGLKQWILRHNMDVSSFGRMMKMHRRTLQRKLAQSSFVEWEGFLITLFCHAYDQGYIVDGMDMMGRIKRKAGSTAGKPRRKRKKKMVAVSRIELDPSNL